MLTILSGYQVFLLVQHSSREWVIARGSTDFYWLVASGTMLLAIFFLGGALNEQLTTRNRLFKEEQAFRSLYEHNPDAVYTLDLNGRVLASNPACLTMMGYAEQELASGTIFQTVVPEDVDRARRHFVQAVNGNPQTFELTVLHKAGHQMEVLVTNVPIYADGEVAGIFGIAKNITAQKAAERERSLSTQKYQDLLETIEAVVWEGNPETFQYLFISPQSLKILGYTPEKLISDHAFWQSKVHPDDFEMMMSYCKQEVAAGRNHEIEYRMIAADGRTVWLKDYVTVVQENGVVTGCRGIMVDITARKLAEERLEHIAYYDVLTSLPNRTLFEDRLHLEMARSRRHSQKLAVLLLDIDRFKYINDTLGHGLGDELIRAVAERLQTCVREGDTVSRIGGDEFTLILPDLRSPQAAVAVAQMILQKMTAPFVIAQTELYATCSIGISFFPDDGTDLQALMKNAESAMYRAKERGRNSYQLYTTSMNEDAMQKLSLERYLRKALGLDEFVLFYQPQVNVQSGEIFGVEALLRWKHPILGMVSPATFIPLAEETGLIVPIGEWVLKTACAQVKRWHAAGYPQLTVAVNLSARQFQQEDLVEMVERVLEETGVEPQFLELEITESVTMHNVERAIVILHELTNLGIRISLDDFGTGYSSLSYLKHFPIHTLKIDQTFVRDITTDADDAAIATSVIALAHSLNLQVVAEGVETEEHLRYLAAQGCTSMQGYHFSRPLPAPEIDALLQSGKTFCYK
ncbi:bifunctional diguanylate cyclase/phosphodiesterase [Tumebacillus sp. BK434]|uniref:putative bifunctional diguanylate cyclase/phosphodiesterase n=1 Tax=Tumebacillus sp. BK434 TaxID=2512169 RepID=UPI001FB2396B|nr:bifunctional diguanylate cyclase/phosphodiesterase [Tumebacillus sp. BK434]